MKHLRDSCFPVNSRGGPRILGDRPRPGIQENKGGDDSPQREVDSLVQYFPEGALLDTPENLRATGSLEGLERARMSGRICEGRAMVCDSAHNLWVDLQGIRGKIPREDGAIGLDDGSARDIAVISRVGKPVCFVVAGFQRAASGETVALLSRRHAQLRCRDEYLSRLRPGDVIPARLTHLDQFGCFMDVGCGISSLLPIDAISVSRISHPRDRFRCGDGVFVVVRGRDACGRLCLSHKELLGTWEENASAFMPGETVAGVVRSVESYGVFVELRPNLAGLAEPYDGIAAGQYASVYIKSLLPEKMKVKLVIIDVFDHPVPLEKPRYFITGGHIDRWTYSPPGCRKLLETTFEEA